VSRPRRKNACPDRNRIDDIRERLAQRRIPCERENCQGWDVFDAGGYLELERCDGCTWWGAHDARTVWDDEIALLPEAQEALRQAQEEEGRDEGRGLRRGNPDFERSRQIKRGLLSPENAVLAAVARQRMGQHVEWWETNPLCQALNLAAMTGARVEATLAHDLAAYQRNFYVGATSTRDTVQFYPDWGGPSRQENGPRYMLRHARWCGCGALGLRDLYPGPFEHEDENELLPHSLEGLRAYNRRGGSAYGHSRGSRPADFLFAIVPEHFSHVRVMHRGARGRWR
jgi:hypothetical protein